MAEGRPKESPRPVARRGHKIAAAGLALVLALLAAEAALRLAAPESLRLQRYMLTRSVFQYEDRAIRFDPEAGFVGAPGSRLRFRNAEFDTDVSLNAAGFRDDEASLSDPTILLAGDSIGMGWGVEKEETAEACLERMLGQTVLNMSMSGYGTIQQSILIRRWLAAHPGDGRLRLVVILFYPNDTRENETTHHGLYPNLLRTGSKVETTRATEAQFQQWLASCQAGMARGLPRHSWVAWLAEDAVSGLRQRWLGWQDPRLVTVTPALEPGTTRVPGDEAFALTLQEASAAARRRGVRMLLAYVPHRTQYEGVDFTKLREPIGVMTRHVRCEFMDLSDRLSRDDYFALDEHLRPAGQRKVAVAIRVRIVAGGLLQPAPASAPATP